MLRVNTKPRRKNSPRIAEKSAPGFLQWLRGPECLAIADGGCAGKIEAAHVDYAGDKGMATKASDKYAVPLCTRHHAKQHQHGWKLFEHTSLDGYEGCALKSAELFWRAWPGRPAWERKLSDG